MGLVLSTLPPPFFNKDEYHRQFLYAKVYISPVIGLSLIHSPKIIGWKFLLFLSGWLFDQAQDC